MALSSAEKKQTKSKANPLIALLNLQPETMWPGERRGGGEETDKEKKKKEEVIEKEE